MELIEGAGVTCQCPSSSALRPRNAASLWAASAHYFCLPETFRPKITGTPHDESLKEKNATIRAFVNEHTLRRRRRGRGGACARWNNGMTDVARKAFRYSFYSRFITLVSVEILFNTHERREEHGDNADEW